MAKGVISRLTYERLGVMLTDSPAYKQSGSIFEDLIRVQSMEYGFSHQSLDVKSVGSDKLTTRNGQSPVIRAPDVSCNINYLFSEGQNEYNAGLFIGKDGSILKNFIGGGKINDINVILVAAHKDTHNDTNHLKLESDFEDYNVIGLGNCFLSSYQYSAQVSQLPVSSLSFEGSNMKFDHYKSSNTPTLPAIKLGVNNVKSSEKIILDGAVFDETFDPEFSATSPGSIDIKIVKKSGNQGGSDIDQVEAAIQSININLPIERQSVYGFGSNYVFNRKLKLPIIGTISMDMIIRGFSEGEIDSFFSKSATYDLFITQPISERMIGEERDFLVDQGHYYLTIAENTWRRTAFAPAKTSPGVGERGDINLSSDGNLFYVCINGSSWGEIPMTASDQGVPNAQVGDLFYTSNFVHAFTQTGWMKFSITEINFDLLDINLSYMIANKLTFEVNDAQLKQQNYSHTIGDSSMVSSELTYGVDKSRGLRLYFS